MKHHHYQDDGYNIKELQVRKEISSYELRYQVPGSCFPLVFTAEDELTLVLFTPNNAKYECKHKPYKTDESRSPSLTYKAVIIEL